MKKWKFKKKKIERKNNLDASILFEKETSFKDRNELIAFPIEVDDWIGFVSMEPLSWLILLT